jgi:predicted TIM-barrel fold metal-dependent hydrolase
MATQVGTPEPRSKREPVSRSKRESYRIIDSDVHPTLPHGLPDLYEYMPRDWRVRFERKTGWNDGSRPLMGRFAMPNMRGVRLDIHGPNGTPAGSDPEWAARDLFDDWNIDCAILYNLQTGNQSNVMTAPDEANVIARAGNEYYAERWLPADPRYMLVMHVAPEDPVAAAAEIRRYGQNPRVAAVALTPINMLFGNRYFWPIYEAASELELPIYSHVVTTQFQYQGAPAVCGGNPESHPEYRSLLGQIAESNVNSLVWTGTFERFPGLKFLFVEYSFTWVLSLLWEMDRNFVNEREATPWLKKRPSEYVHENIRFSTQPLVEAPRDELYQLIDLMGPDLLMFSSDYPHFDNDPPAEVFRGLDPEVQRMIYVDNALDAFRIPA